MEHVVCRALLVFTLSQLCRAEISQILPGPWFSANAINDEFSPKPISELFTSTVTLSTGQNTSPVTQPTFSVTQSPPTITVKQSQPTFSVTEPIVVLSPVSTPTPSLYPYKNSAQSTSTTLLQTFSTANPSSTPFPTFSQDLSSTQFTPSSSQTPTILDVRSYTQPKETPTINIVPPSSTLFPTFSTPSPTTPSTAPPSVIVVFRDPPIVTPSEGASTISTLAPRITTVSTSLGSTTVTPAITNSVTTSPFTSLPICQTSSINTKTTFSTSNTASFTPSTLVDRPLSTRKPSLLIRVVAPKGSITNVKINPTTSTPRPRTKRTSKPKKNTYDGCIQSCRGRKDILCSIPLSSTTIDPKDLKSFPSICHMACHNSYRSPAYEMLVEGRCSRLRTRIMTVGSNTKLKRDELKKSEYSIVNTGPSAVVEFSNGSIRK